MIDRSLSLPGLRRGAALAAIFSVALAAGWLAPEVARADIALALDLDVLVETANDHIDSGGGGAVRLGWQLHLPLFALTPEIGFGWSKFGDGPSVYRGIAGARLGIGEIIRFGLFGHIGYAQADYESDYIEDSDSGLLYDVGLFFDITLIPLLDIGVHMAYNHLSGEDDAVDQEPELALPSINNLGWLNFGVHAALVF